MKRILIGSIVVAGAWFAACGVDYGDDDPEEVRGATGTLRLMIDAEGATDVQAAELSIAHCGMSSKVVSKTMGLDRWTHDGMVPSYIDDKNHLYIEYFAALDAGCYDVEMTLLTASGEPTKRCTTAAGSAIDIIEGQTREVILYSRCDAHQGAGHQELPTVEMIQFSPSAFMGCDGLVDVCATVRRDDDALDLSWDQHLTTSFSKGATISSPVLGGMYNGECVRSPQYIECRADKERPRVELIEQCTTWSLEAHGETTGELQAAKKLAPELGHRVFFSMFMECPDREKEVVLPGPPEGEHDYEKYPGKPKKPKPPKDDSDDVEVIAALNHAPQIEAVEHIPSKFLECPAEVKLCATASDADGDPLEFSWDQIDGPPVQSGPLAVTGSKSESMNTDCVRYTFPDKGASYSFELTVRDLFYDDDGALIPAEDWLSERMEEDIQSRATLEIPVHVGCDKKKK